MVAIGLGFGFMALCILVAICVVAWVLLVLAMTGWHAMARRPGFEAWRVRWRHRRAAPAPIGALRENQLGRMAGRVAMAEPPLTAPLSGRPCVLYALAILERTGNHWTLRVVDHQGVRFVIEDRSGNALVDPSRARLALPFDCTGGNGWFENATPEQEALLHQHGLRSEGLLFPKRWRFREAVVEVGDDVEVVGAGIREPDAAAETTAGYRDAPPTRLHVSHSSSAPLSIRSLVQR